MSDKLTLISIDVRGKNYPAFVKLFVWEDGKVRLPGNVDQRTLCNVPKEFHGDCMQFNGPSR